MSASRSWLVYPITYCAREMEMMAGWIQRGVSGAVVGPAGVGKSNLLAFFCHRPDARQLYLPVTAVHVAPVFIDLNDLPAYDPATFYRLILRSCYETRGQFTPVLAEAIAAAYQTTRTAPDPFALQSDLREFLLLCQTEETQVVFILDRFDRFCQQATPLLTDTLRALRDSFKGTLLYFAGMRQEIAHLSDPAVLGELYEVLDTNVCRVRPLTFTDAQHLVEREWKAVGITPDEEVTDRLISLTGGYPSLLKAACHWQLKKADEPASVTAEMLLAEPPIRRRLEELWDCLSPEEQRTLIQLQMGVIHSEFPELQPTLTLTLTLLADKGLVQKSDSGWAISGELLAAYAHAQSGSGREQLWLDAVTQTIYRGQTPVENLTPLERSLLTFLLSQPKVKHTYTAVIEAVWPANVHKKGVSNEALFQVVAGVRRRIEPDPSHPCYLVNWRGVPEGGYQCFPEGKPGNQ